MSIVSTRDNEDSTHRWSDTLVTYEPPAKVTNLEVKKDTNGSTTIFWLNPAFLNNFKIELWIKTGEGGTYSRFKTFDTFTGDAGEANITIQNQPDTLFFQLRILDSDDTPYGNAESLGDVSVTVILPVMNAVTITSVTTSTHSINKTATVKWTLPSGGVGQHTGFRVKVKVGYRTYTLDVDADATQAVVPLTDVATGATVEHAYVYTVYDNGEALGMVESAQYKK